MQAQSPAGPWWHVFRLAWVSWNWTSAMCLLSGSLRKKHTQLASFCYVPTLQKSAIMMAPTVGLQSPSPQSTGDKRAWMQGALLRATYFFLVLNYVKLFSTFHVSSTTIGTLRALSHCILETLACQGYWIWSLFYRWGNKVTERSGWIAQDHAVWKQQSHILNLVLSYFKAPTLAVDFEEHKVWRVWCSHSLGDAVITVTML